MASFGTMQDRINQDYLNRTDLSAECRRAIQASIRHYERQRFPWNEAYTAMTTSAGQTFVSLPSDFLQLDLIQVSFNSADFALTPTPFSTLRELNIQRGPNNLPTHYCIYQNRIELAPYPDSAYSMPCYYIKQLPALSASADVNDWVSAAEDLIVYRATNIMWGNVLRNPQEAQYYKQQEREALGQILSNRDQFFTSPLKATKF